MENPIQQANTLPLLEFRQIKFKGRTVRYTPNTITYKGETTRFENSLIVAGTQLYIQTPLKTVFATSDIKNFEFLGMGEIVGVVETSLVATDRSSYWIYCNGMKMTLRFYIQDDRICYMYGKKEHTENIETASIIYETFFIVIYEDSSLFIDFLGSNDVQCKFAGKVVKYYKFRCNKMDFFIFEYVKHNRVHKALFYHNELICTDISIRASSDGPSILYNTAKCSRYGDSNQDSTDRRHQPAQIAFIESRILKSPDYEKICKLQNCIPTNEENSTIFELSDIEYKAFFLAPVVYRIAFLKSKFAGYSFDIVSVVFDKMMHMSKTIAGLVNEKYECNKFPLQPLFYEPADISAVKRMGNFRFRNKLSRREQVFLERKYERIFKYDNEIKRSKNLAYRVIKRERAYLETLNIELLFNEATKSRVGFIKLINTYYQDPRIEDILEILLESAITIQSDISDVCSSRQSTFLLRHVCGIGAFVANYKQLYHNSLYKPQIKVNNVIFDEKLPKDMLFFTSANLFSYYRKPSTPNMYEQLGYELGKGIISGISRESLDQYLALATTAEESILGLLYLVISTYIAQSDLGRNHNINTVLRSGLESTDLGIKQAVMCALAIQNLGNHDRNILELIKAEIEKYGPVMSERNTAFYDAEYRMVGAICTALVANRPLLRNFNDSFSELIVCGLSSVGSGLPLTLLERGDDCRPEEIFYSVLLKLTSDFIVEPLVFLNDLRQSICTQSTNNIYRLAAEIFYISLYYLKRDEEVDECIFRKLYDFTMFIEEEVIEKPTLQILFNFSIASLSIMKVGRCDIELCRLLRRAIMKTKETKYMKECTLFDRRIKDVTTLKGYDAESVQIYKLCLGIACLNFGMSKFKSTAVKQLIVTFFITNTVISEFNVIDVLRMLIVKQCEDNKDNVENLKLVAKNLFLKSKRKSCMRLFSREFEQLDDIDKKFVIDVLSDYYENVHFKKYEDSVFDMKMLAKFLVITK